MMPPPPSTAIADSLFVSPSGAGEEVRTPSITAQSDVAPPLMAVMTAHWVTGSERLGPCSSSSRYSVLKSSLSLRLVGCSGPKRLGERAFNLPFRMLVLGRGRRGRRSAGSMGRQTQMMPVEISAALMPFVNVKQEQHIVRGNLRPQVNLRLIVACVGVGAESQASSKADYAENRCT